MFDQQGLGHAHVGTEIAGADDWREIHRQMQRIAGARARVDIDELTWLPHAERAAIHRHFGHASIYEYIERVLGYGPRVARERLRVARALASLPALATELARGRLAYSAVRELTRVITPQTERDWIDAARGKTLREIEELVAGRAAGSKPEDPADPDLRPVKIELELTPATLALFRDASRRLEAEIGHPLTDDELIAILCTSDAGAADDGRAPYQIALTVCARCDRGWHDAAGHAFDVPASTVEQARCNAQHVGRVDAEAPARATQDIPPATQRLVRRRDRGRCCVPGCRSSRFLQLHHIEPRAAGGSHDPSNVMTTCFGHHAAIHQGRLRISGAAPDALVFVWCPADPAPA